MVLSNPSYLKQAARAARFILTHLRHGGRLYRIYKDGAPSHNAYLDDYAFIIASLLDMRFTFFSCNLSVSVLYSQ